MLSKSGVFLAAKFTAARYNWQQSEDQVLRSIGKDLLI